MAKINKATSNADFARRVGIHFTMASRIRTGARLPSTKMMGKIAQAFDLSDADYAAMMRVSEEGKEAFGAWVRQHLFFPDVSAPTKAVSKSR